MLDSWCCLCHIIDFWLKNRVVDPCNRPDIWHSMKMNLVVHNVAEHSLQ